MLHSAKLYKTTYGLLVVGPTNTTFTLLFLLFPSPLSPLFLSPPATAESRAETEVAGVGRSGGSSGGRGGEQETAPGRVATAVGPSTVPPLLLLL